MTRSLFGGSATLVALLASISVFDTTTLLAVTPQQQSSTALPASSATRPRTVTQSQATDTAEEPETTQPDSETPPAQAFTATAYSLRGRTATGHQVRRGIIAADRRVLPLGTRVRLKAGAHSGEYLVADTGGAVRGRKIDIWVPSTSEAMRFGRRGVQLTVLQYPRGKKASNKKAPNHMRPRTVK